jgi:two-component system response regulator HydG
MGHDDHAVTMLVIAWCAPPPSRVGEVMVAPPEGSAHVLGRADASEVAESRVRFFRQRPGVLEPTAPLDGQGLSRRQLVIRANGEALDIERVGRCALRVNGRDVDSARVAVGDVVEVRRELVMLSVRRPPRIAQMRHFARETYGEFGVPDRLGILGESPAVWELRDAIAFAAKAGAHSLIVGESGTGKELAARGVHRLSTRAAGPFVARNAATLPAGLIDAELFGNMRNYPNPGMAERAGLVGEADGGMLFLDEIGELPSELQSHLLRVLDSGGEYQRLGDARTRRSDLRFIGATNRDPEALKHDFVARFTSRVEVPSLDSRREDVPLLLNELALRAAERNPDVAARFVAADASGRRYARLSPSFVARALRETLSANVRSLDALLWDALRGSDGDEIRLRLKRAVVRSTPPSSSSGSAPAAKPPRAPPTPEQIRDALAGAKGNITHAARALGISSRFALKRLMQRHKITSEAT